MDGRAVFIDGNPAIFLYYFSHYRQPAIGLTNRLRDWGWTWYIDSDRPRLYDVREAWLVVKTHKGHHYYMDAICKTFWSCMKRFYKLHKEIGDTGQIKLARLRYEKYGMPLLVIRIYGKYDYDDIRVVKVREPREFPAAEKILSFFDLF